MEKFTRFTKSAFELITLAASTLLLIWGTVGRRKAPNAAVYKKISALGFMLLFAWVILAAIPALIRGLTRDGELKRFKESG